jgi:hypothetical protein
MIKYIKNSVLATYACVENKIPLINMIKKITL